MSIAKLLGMARCFSTITQVPGMLRRHDHIAFNLLSILLIVLHVVSLSGCMTTKQNTFLPDELKYPQEGKIIELVLNSGEIIRFDKDGGGFIESVHEGRLYRTIVGVTDKGNTTELEIDRIQEVRIERREANVLGTVVLITVGVPVVFVAVVLVELTINPPHSCPYIYSFDGNRYVFDGQSYAGAISRGLKRTDYTRLNFLKPVDSMYHLLLKNDPPDETQYTDETKLLVVDHDPRALVAFGYDATLYSVYDLQTPLNVVERRQGDVTKFFTVQDGASWQSKLPTDSTYKREPLRDQLTLAFPRPRGARNAALCIYGGSAYWGSAMIKHFISMRGNRVYDWYHSLQQKGPELKELFHFMEGQELYHLSVNVYEGTTWKRRAVIRSGSSLADEYRIIPLDLSNVQGDTLWIRMNPPRGFWKFDYAAISYQCEPDSQFTELAALRAENEDGIDLRGVLMANDESYDIQKRPNEASKLWFTVPQQEPGTERSLFLKTSGYYIIHTDTTHNENVPQLHKLFSSDSAGVEYALDEYLRQIKKIQSK